MLVLLALKEVSTCPKSKARRVSSRTSPSFVSAADARTSSSHRNTRARFSTSRLCPSLLVPTISIRPALCPAFVADLQSALSKGITLSLVYQHLF